MLHRGQFSPDELVRVEGDFVVLNSGGPLLRVETVEGDNILCSWDEDGKTCRHLISTAMLSRLVPFGKEAKQ